MEHKMAHEVEHCTLADLAKITIEGNEADGAEFVAIVDEYLSHFCKPVYENDARVCPKCGSPLDAFKQALGIGAAIQWGLVHGEGRCSGMPHLDKPCGWPYRGMHYIKGKDAAEDDDPILTMRNQFLAYHPDEVEVRSTTDKIKDALAGVEPE